MKQKKQPFELIYVLFKLIYRTTFFLLLLTVVGVLLYISGNFQGFQDSLQRIILLVTSTMSIFLVMFSASGILILLIFFTRKRKIKNLRYFLLMIPSLVIGTVFIFAFRIIYTLSVGL